MNKTQIRIATRESPLALWQANWVKSRLQAFHPDLDIQLLGMTTQADRLPYLSLSEAGGKGLFVKELEEALLDRRADIAVHSMKDLPMILPDGLILPVICERDLPWDVLVSNQYGDLAELPSGAIVGSSSLRRQSQLLALRPDIRIRALRGNVNTRLSKLDQGEYDAIILAGAGMQRLGLLNSRKTVRLDLDDFLPAAGQGALGIECRAEDTLLLQNILSLKHADSFACVSAERAMCRSLGVGCQVPVGAYAVLEGAEIHLKAYVATSDGQHILRAEGRALDADVLGQRVAENLIVGGAEAILKAST